MLGDWAYGLIIGACALGWMRVFMDYRSKLTRVIPGTEDVDVRKQELRDRIAESRAHTEELTQSIQDLSQEISRLDQRRRDLQQRLSEKEMVRIPAGKFRMGCSAPGREDESPEHLVYLTSFYIDRFEVTNLQYKDFVDVTGHKEPSHWRNRTFPERRSNHPVTNVSWHDAVAYAEWVGKRLPTEAEWEYAARGDTGWDYAFGKSCGTEYCNFLSQDGTTTKVNGYPRGLSPFGVWDMCGNVGEWVADYYDPAYYRSSPEREPTGPEEGHLRVFRGGFYHGNRQDVRATARHSGVPDAVQQYIGFRCAMDVAAEPPRA